MIRRALGWLLCLVGEHAWTSRHQQGLVPDPEKIRANPVGYFFEWSTMYCDRCGHVNRRTTR